MKNFKILAVSLVVSVMSMSAVPCSAANKIDIPKEVATTVLDMAVEMQCLSPTEAKWLKDHNGLQQCMDAYTESGYNMSAAVDKLAELSVQAGYYPSVAKAKESMKAIADQARRNDNLWNRIYNVLGL